MNCDDDDLAKCFGLEIARPILDASFAEFEIARYEGEKRMREKCGDGRNGKRRVSDTLQLLIWSLNTPRNGQSDLEKKFLIVFLYLLFQPTAPKLVLTWLDNSDDETGFLIERTLSEIVSIVGKS
jgi:hypothetical protein